MQPCSLSPNHRNSCIVKFLSQVFWGSTLTLSALSTVSTPAIFLKSLVFRLHIITVVIIPLTAWKILWSQS